MTYVGSRQDSALVDDVPVREQLDAEDGMASHDGTASNGLTTEVRAAEVRWDSPGPGCWELDRSHFLGGATSLVQEIQTTAMPVGMRRVFRELGTPADTLDAAFVNGFMYTRLRPLVGADKPARRLPPLPVLKLLVRVHPEMRRRAKTAERMLAERPWRRVVAAWENGRRAEIERGNLELQDVELGALDDAALLAHVDACFQRCLTLWEEHFWMHGYDLGPIGILLFEGRSWGLDVRELVELLEGASPSTSDPVKALTRIRASVEAAGAEPATLDEVRQISPEVAADLDRYLRFRHALLFSRYDLDGLTLGEVPDVVLATILTSEVRDTSSAVAERTARVRRSVPSEHRALFDERLAEARAAMNLRDDNGPTTAEWPLGLLRLALLEVGRRLVENGHANRREDALELTSHELESALPGGGRGPTADELARRAVRRRELSHLDPPLTIGAPEPAPPPEVLPGPLAELVGMVQIVIEQLGMGGSGRAEQDGLSGTGIGSTSYRGRARRASSPEEALELLEPGDVLVVPCTTPAYNVVLSIAGAVVTGSGGPLCHAAVLARELGIPAVVGARGALYEIPDGSMVEVDPVAGTVRVISGDV
jgi:rifampicin phosphotransferase